MACFSHHKCASSWMERICGEVCRELRKRFSIAYSADMFAGNLAKYVRDRRLDFLAYSNADYRYVRQLPLQKVRGIHLVRDPRDVVVSAYYSHRNSHPTDAWPALIEHRERLLSCSKDEGLFLEMDFRAAQFEEMLSWKEQVHGDNIRLLRMEEVTARPYESLLEVFSELGLVDQEELTPARRIAYIASKACRRIEYVTRAWIPLPYGIERVPAERLLGIVWENNFQRLAGGRKKGQEDVGHHYRKGSPGDWRNHFSAEHVEYFQERYNDLLLFYGYESEPNWDTESFHDCGNGKLVATPAAAAPASRLN